METLNIIIGHVVPVPAFRINSGRQTKLFANVCIGIGTQSSRHKMGGSSPALRVILIIGDRVDEFICGAVSGIILHEKFLVIVVQRVSHINHVFGGILGFLPLSRSGIHLGIQVHTCQNSPNGSFRGAGIRHIAFFRHFRSVGQTKQFLFYPGIKIGTTYLFGKFTPNIPFHGKRRVSKEVKQQIIEKCPVEPGLGTVLVHKIGA